jgi:hypothetical protein
VLAENKKKDEEKEEGGKKKGEGESMNIGCGACVCVCVCNSTIINRREIKRTTNEPMKNRTSMSDHTMDLIDHIDTLNTNKNIEQQMKLT